MTLSLYYTMGFRVALGQKKQDNLRWVHLKLFFFQQAHKIRKFDICSQNYVHCNVFLSFYYFFVFLNILRVDLWSSDATVFC